MATHSSILAWEIPWTVEPGGLQSVGLQRDTGSIPELGRSPGGVHVNPLQYPCLENSMNRGAWWSKESDTTEAT